MAGVRLSRIAQRRFAARLAPRPTARARARDAEHAVDASAAVVHHGRRPGNGAPRRRRQQPLHVRRRVEDEEPELRVRASSRSRASGSRPRSIAAKRVKPLPAMSYTRTRRILHPHALAVRAAPESVRCRLRSPARSPASSDASGTLPAGPTSSRLRPHRLERAPARSTRSPARGATAWSPSIRRRRTRSGVGVAPGDRPVEQAHRLGGSSPSMRRAPRDSHCVRSLAVDQFQRLQRRGLRGARRGHLIADRPAERAGQAGRRDAPLAAVTPDVARQ